MSIPTRSHSISLAQAAELTRRHREQNPDQEKAGSFHADQVRELLAQPGVAGLRYYHGLNEDGSYAIILVGQNERMEDLVEGVMLELHFPCPPICAQPNMLNESDPLAIRRKRLFRRAPLRLPSRDHRIELEVAREMTRAWRLAHPKAEKGGVFHADQIREILDQPNCLAMRYYHGVNEDGSYALIWVGVDEAGADMPAVMRELHFPCPPICASPNDLNTSAWVARERLERVPMLVAVE
jgi:hypothetical protein